MATPFETFQQRFSGPPLGQYNPFGTANQYASPYAPGVFQPIPTTGTPQPPVTGGGQLGGGNNPPGTGQGGEGGRDNESGRGEGGMPFGHSAIDMGMADEAMTAGGLLAPAGVGLIGGLINGAVNANNLAYRDNVLQGVGMPGLTPGQQIGGLLGLNNYGEGHGLLNSEGVNIGGRNYGVSVDADPTQGGGVYDGKTTLTVDEMQNRFNTLGPTAPPPGGLLSAPSTAKPASAASIKAAQTAAYSSIQKAIQSLPQEDRYRQMQKMKAAYDASISGLQKAGTLNATTLSQAGQLAKSGLGLQKGTPGRSGSQIKGGQTVGNNPNDRSGRNPGAPSKAGAGGRLGGGV